MNKEDIQVDMKVKFKNGTEGTVKKIGMIFYKIKLDNGEIVWAISREIEPV